MKSEYNCSRCAHKASRVKAGKHRFEASIGIERLTTAEHYGV